jgi:hypothetical protein
MFETKVASGIIPPLASPALGSGGESGIQLEQPSLSVSGVGIGASTTLT